ncbi:hypothetical protein GF324_05245 [bacterium]|nr:hypothetical protein [bacterium]
MTRRELFDRMVELAEKVFDRVEVTKGDFRGGVCRLRGQSCLYINRNAGLETNVRTLANALSQQDLESMFVMPALRDAIETYRED